jgi:DNA-binding GntR family transcriptional regulator
VRLLTDQPTLAEQVFEAVVAEIVEGRLQPNQRLIQEDIAAQLGVSRQPVQQALLLLRAEGFVHEAPGRGLIVAPIDVEFVRDIYEVRAVSEGLACRLAAQRGAERARKDGAALIRAGRFAEAEGSIPLLIDADMRFHKFLYEISGNKVIKETTGPHWRHLQRVMAEVLMRDETPRQIWDQHEEILEAVSQGDARAAERIARLHITRAADIYIARLKAMKSSDGEADGADSPPPKIRERRRKP